MGTLCTSLPPTNEAALRFRFKVMMLRMLDSNNDGLITLNEIQPFWELAQPASFGPKEFNIQFSAIDVDGDGAISVDDFIVASTRPAPPQIVPISFKVADSDQDGRLSEAKAVQVAVALRLGDEEHVRYAVQQADHDGDGSLDISEFVDATEELRRGGEPGEEVGEVVEGSAEGSAEVGAEDSEEGSADGDVENGAEGSAEGTDEEGKAVLETEYVPNDI